LERIEEGLDPWLEVATFFDPGVVTSSQGSLHRGVMASESHEIREISCIFPFLLTQALPWVFSYESNSRKCNYADPLLLLLPLLLLSLSLYLSREGGRGERYRGRERGEGERGDGERARERRREGGK